MYTDVHQFVKTCLECATVSGGGRIQRPPLCPIPVQRPFQIIGVDIMALPKTSQGNQYDLVFSGLSHQVAVGVSCLISTQREV